MGVESINTKSLSPAVAAGDIIRLHTTQSGHNNGISPLPISENTAANFSETLMRSLEKVNDQQINAESLAQKMIADPSSVQAHTVMIAAEKARISLTLAKSIADLAVRTYRELTSLR